MKLMGPLIKLISAKKPIKSIGKTLSEAGFVDEIDFWTGSKIEYNFYWNS